MNAPPRHDPRAVFSDTSGYYAATVARDENYAAATAILAHLRLEQVRFFTTLYVIAELHALVITRRRDPRFALQVVTSIEAGATTIVPVSDDDHVRARAILAQQQDKLYSLTDTLSFAVMERLGIRRVFSFDHNFAQHGFQLVAP